MKSITPLLLALGLLLAPPAAARDDDPVLPKSAPVAFGEAWTVGVAIPQDEIATDVEIGRVASDSMGGGGLLGGLIIAAQDNKGKVMRSNASQRAEAAVKPLREVLQNVDIRALAQMTTIAAFNTQNVEPTLTAERFLGANKGVSAGAVTYTYSLSPDFTQIRISADIALSWSDASKPALEQRVTSIVQLKKRSYEPRINVRSWSADDGELAKVALDAGFKRLETLIPQIAAMNRQQFDQATSKKQAKAFLAGFYGPELFRDDLGPTIWTDEGAIALQSK